MKLIQVAYYATMVDGVWRNVDLYSRVCESWETHPDDARNMRDAAKRKTEQSRNVAAGAFDLDAGRMVRHRSAAYVTEPENVVSVHVKYKAVP